MSLWRRAALRRQAFGRGRVLVSAGAQAETMGALLADALDSCSELSTLEEHAARAWRRAGGRARYLALEAAEVVFRRGGGEAGEGRDALRSALELLARDGFLVPRERLTGVGRALGGPVEVSRLAVMAAGPAAGLEEALAALGAAAADLASRPSLAVYDPGDGLEALRRAACARAGVRFVGAAERAALREKLIAAGAPEAAARAALSGLGGLAAGPGAARNAALLEAGGAGLVMLEAAAGLGAVRAPDAAPGLSLRTGVGPRRWLFGDEARELMSGESETLWLAELLDVLGRPARSLAAEADAAGALDLSEAGDGWAGRTDSAVVRLAYLGAAGPGLVEGAATLSLDPAARAELFADGAKLADALSGGWAAGFAPILALHDRPSLRTQAFGVDLRPVPPPFLPSGPDARALFRQLLASSQPDAAAAELPWLAPASSLEPEPSSGAPRLSRLVGELAAAVPGAFRTREPGEELARLGAGIASLADRPDAEWSRWARNVRWNALRGALEGWNARLRPWAPRPWKRAVEAECEKLRRALVAPDLLVPREAADASHGRILVLETARFLEAWPRLWAAALKER